MITVSTLQLWFIGDTELKGIIWQMISGYFKYMDLARLKHLGILIEIIGRVLSRKAIQRSSVLNLCLMMSDVNV